MDLSLRLASTAQVPPAFRSSRLKSMYPDRPYGLGTLYGYETDKETGERDRFVISEPTDLDVNFVYAKELRYFCSALASPPGNTSTTTWLHTKRGILRWWYPRRHQKGLINMALPDAAYDPFERGRFPVGVRTIEALDSGRNRLFNCEIWYPATVAHAGEDLAFETQDAFSVPNRNEQRRQAAVRNVAAERGNYPLVVFSHASAFHRRGGTFLCTHLASHGYVVAALDHSEVVAPELSPKQNETDEQKAARWDEAIASRVPDVRFLLDQLVDSPLPIGGIAIDVDAIGIVGHSFGGWAALAVP